MGCLFDLHVFLREIGVFPHLRLRLIVFCFLAEAHFAVLSDASAKCLLEVSNLFLALLFTACVRVVVLMVHM